MHQPVLLVDEVPESLPSELVDYLRSVESVYWRNLKSNLLAPCLRLHKVKDVWHFELQDQNSRPGTGSHESRRTRSRSTSAANVSLSFSDLLGAHRLDSRALHTELVLKAVLGRKGIAGISRGASGNEDRARMSVVDATAGLGRDAMLLAAAGCNVIAIERNPLIAFLLQEARASAEKSDQAALRSAAMNVVFRCADSIEYLSCPGDVEPRPDVVYIDPMYSNAGAAANAPDSGGLKKTAAVKKNAQLLQCIDSIFSSSLETVANQGEKLLNQALQVARQKVVVKRAPRAPWMGECKPSSSVSGKAVRFDIYAC